jgi:hypothetical protein
LEVLTIKINKTMGQYYNAVVLKKNWKQAKNPVEAPLRPRDFGRNGAKIMEHSYVGNKFVNAVAYLLANQYKGYPFVWVGDYADSVMTNTGEHNIYDDADTFIYKDENYEDYTKRYNELKAGIPDEAHHYKYVVNYTKKQYCIIPKYKEGAWVIHPLPLLTSSGNGRGGGDYEVDDERVGMWAFDRIGITDDKAEIAGFKQISGYFKPDW